MGKRYALLIGCWGYDHGKGKKKINALKSPENDIKELKEVLAAPGFGAFDEVKILPDPGVAEASETIEEFFSGRFTDDMLLFYFSGHGDTNDDGEFFMLIKNTKSNLLRSTAISSSFLKGIVDDCRSKSVVIILDCCYSGAFNDGMKSGAASVKVNKHTFLKKGGTGRFVLTSSNSTQKSWEGEKIIQEIDTSLFTHFLLKGITSGDADTDEDGIISIDEWFKYTEKEIGKIKVEQTPKYWTFDKTGDICIAYNPRAENKLGKSSLPRELFFAANSQLASLRHGAIDSLGELLYSENECQRMEAEKLLEKLLKENDDEIVKKVTTLLRNFQLEKNDNIPGKTKICYESLTQIDLGVIVREQTYSPSPIAWEDQVIYQLIIDRFSDGREKGYRDANNNIVNSGITPMLDPLKEGLPATLSTPKITEGKSWHGGTLEGVKSKLGYLKRLGITTIRLSPFLKQAVYSPGSYHGYAIQNFLEVDPHFGSRDDLRKLVNAAHRLGFYIIADFCIHHAGDVFAYSGNDSVNPIYNKGRKYQVKGYRDNQGNPVLPFKKLLRTEYPQAFPDGAVWPIEFQSPECFHQKGQIADWNDNLQIQEGDFDTLKAFKLQKENGQQSKASQTLKDLCKIAKYWIAYTDLDGYFIDLAKHIPIEALRFFCKQIHQFTQSIGKHNFYIFGEILNEWQKVFQYLEKSDIDAAYGLGHISLLLEEVVKGKRDAHHYFDPFHDARSLNKNDQTWYRNKIVICVDDNDQTFKNVKARFCHNFQKDEQNEKLAFNALCLSIMSLGIPSIYYGSEQLLKGSGDCDCYIRESMFGGVLGPFNFHDRHCFNDDTPLYQELQKLLDLRRKNIILRRGSMYLRPLSAKGDNFYKTHVKDEFQGKVIPWSRIFNDQEILLVMNNHIADAITVYITIDNSLHQPGDEFRCIFSRHEKNIDKIVQVCEKNGKALQLTIPAADTMIYAAIS